MLDYWLARGEGFAVVSASGARRRVHHVVVDPRRGSAALVVVASRFGGRLHTLPADAFAAVDPFRRMLYLERPTTERAGHAFAAVARMLARAARASSTGIERLQPRVRAGATGAMRSTRTAVARMLAGAGRAGATAIERLQPHVRAGAIGAARSTRAAVARLRPRARAAARDGAVLLRDAGLWLQPRLRAGAHAAVRAALAIVRRGVTAHRAGNSSHDPGRVS